MRLLEWAKRALTPMGAKPEGETQESRTFGTSAELPETCVGPRLVPAEQTARVKAALQSLACALDGRPQVWAGTYDVDTGSWLAGRATKIHDAPDLTHTPGKKLELMYFGPMRVWTVHPQLLVPIAYDVTFGVTNARKHLTRQSAADLLLWAASGLVTARSLLRCLQRTLRADDQLAAIGVIISGAMQDDPPFGETGAVSVESYLSEYDLAFVPTARQILTQQHASGEPARQRRS